MYFFKLTEVYKLLLLAYNFKSSLAQLKKKINSYFNSRKSVFYEIEPHFYFTNIIKTILVKP